MRRCQETRQRRIPAVLWTARGLRMGAASSSQLPDAGGQLMPRPVPAGAVGSAPHGIGARAPPVPGRHTPRLGGRGRAGRVASAELHGGTGPTQLTHAPRAARTIPPGTNVAGWPLVAGTELLRLFLARPISTPRRWLRPGARKQLFRVHSAVVARVPPAAKPDRGSSPLRIGGRSARVRVGWLHRPALQQPDSTRAAALAPRTSAGPPRPRRPRPPKLGHCDQHERHPPPALLRIEPAHHLEHSVQ
mmetsp:Transcript_16539/g.52605  ORF Transcript_16539/g.52605 Transcript_16539/m.52605 type:complete len:247 (+) Transcript_16539:497-1237(+)